MEAGNETRENCYAWYAAFIDGFQGNRLHFDNYFLCSFENFRTSLMGKADVNTTRWCCALIIPKWQDIAEWTYLQSGRTQTNNINKEIECGWPAQLFYLLCNIPLLNVSMIILFILFVILTMEHSCYSTILNSFSRFR